MKIKLFEKFVSDHKILDITSTCFEFEIVN